jgi:hypothetical protein
VRVCSPAARLRYFLTLSKITLYNSGINAGNCLALGGLITCFCYDKFKFKSKSDSQYQEK